MYATHIYAYWHNLYYYRVGYRGYLYSIKMLVTVAILINDKKGFSDVIMSILSHNNWAMNYFYSLEFYQRKVTYFIFIRV